MKFYSLKFIPALFLLLLHNSAISAKVLSPRLETKGDTSTLRSDRCGSQENSAEFFENVLLRVNCGGNDVTGGGVTFGADKYANGGRETGNTIGEPITNANVDIYSTERSSLENADFGYEIPVTNGKYTVILHFAEIYFTGQAGKGANRSGKRVFDVLLEGNTVLDNYDINKDVGSMVATTKTFENIIVTDEKINIDFTAIINNPKISGFEILSDAGQISSSDCQWTGLSDALHDHIEGQSAVVDGKLYMFGSVTSFGKSRGSLGLHNEAEVYDVDADKWANITPMPFQGTHAGMQAVGNEIWIVGGFIGPHRSLPSPIVQIYNTRTDTWRSGPELPFAAAAGAAALIGDNLHYFGGLKEDRATNSEFHYYLDTTNESKGWRQLADMPQARCHVGGTSADGILYAIAGQFGHDGGRTLTNLVHAYDPKTDTWTQKADLPDTQTGYYVGDDEGASHFEMGTITHNGKIMVAGGIYERREILELDPSIGALGAWSQVCLLPDDTALTPTMFVHEDRLIVTCGGLDNWNPTQKTRWTSITPTTTTTNTLSRIEAEDFDNKSTSPQVEVNTAIGITNIGFIKNNDWLKFNDIDLTGIQSLDARVSCKNVGGTIEVRLGSTSGTLVAEAFVENTGGNDSYKTVNFDLGSVTGTNDIYFVFTGGNRWLFNIDWFEFSTQATPTPTVNAKLEAEDFSAKSTSPQIEVNTAIGITNVGFIKNNDWLKFDDVDLTGMQSFEARISCKNVGGTIEVRLGSTSGTLIGEASVQNTGGNDNYEIVSASLESVTGIKDIYFVFTGGNRWLFNVDWFEFSSTTTGAKAIASANVLPIIVYPNPSKGLINLTNIPEKAVTMLSDLSGKKIKVAETINGTTRIIDISALNSGMYIISVNGERRTIIKE